MLMRPLPSCGALQPSRPTLPSPSCFLLHLSSPPYVLSHPTTPPPTPLWHSIELSFAFLCIYSFYFSFYGAAFLFLHFLLHLLLFGFYSLHSFRFRLRMAQAQDVLAHSHSHSASLYSLSPFSHLFPTSPFCPALTPSLPALPYLYPLYPPCWFVVSFLGLVGVLIGLWTVG